VEEERDTRVTNRNKLFPPKSCALNFVLQALNQALIPIVRENDYVFINL